MYAFCVLYTFGSVLILASSLCYLIGQCIGNSSKTKGIVFILRGVPGSGKNTWIQNYITCTEIKRYSILSANDHFIETDGAFHFNPRELPKAHAKCFRSFFRTLKKGCPYIFITNPNAQVWEYENYEAVALHHGYTVHIIELPCSDEEGVEFFRERSAHKIPLTNCKAMYDRWQSDEEAECEEEDISYNGDSLPTPRWTREALDIQLDQIVATRDAALKRNGASTTHDVTPRAWMPRCRSGKKAYR